MKFSEVIKEVFDPKALESAIQQINTNVGVINQQYGEYKKEQAAKAVAQKQQATAQQKATAQAAITKKQGVGTSQKVPTTAPVATT